MPSTKRNVGAPKEKSTTNKNSSIAPKERITQVDIGAAQFLEEQRNNPYIGFYLTPNSTSILANEDEQSRDEVLTQAEINAYKKFVNEEEQKLNQKLRESKRTSESLVDDNVSSRQNKINKIISQHFGVTQMDAPQLHNIYYVVIDACDKSNIAKLEEIRKQKIFEGNRAFAQADRLIVTNAAERVKNIRYLNQDTKKRPSLEARENEIRSLYKEVYKYVSVWVDNELVKDLQNTSIGHLYNNLDKKKKEFDQQNFERVQGLKDEVAKHLLALTLRRFVIGFSMEIAAQQNDRGAKTQLTLILQHEPSLILREDIAKSENIDHIQQEVPTLSIHERLQRTGSVLTMFTTPPHKRMESQPLLLGSLQQSTKEVKNVGSLQQSTEEVENGCGCFAGLKSLFRRR